jgi:hypothetical protein
VLVDTRASARTERTAGRTPYESSVTVSRSGHLVACMRLRSSVSSASGKPNLERANSRVVAARVFCSFSSGHELLLRLWSCIGRTLVAVVLARILRPAAPRARGTRGRRPGRRCARLRSRRTPRLSPVLRLRAGGPLGLLLRAKAELSRPPNAARESARSERRPQQRPRVGQEVLRGIGDPPLLLVSTGGRMRLRMPTHLHESWAQSAGPAAGDPRARRW